jgi:DNA polymerase I-like protein with 3'-5' exonuclease and polymerase domains
MMKECMVALSDYFKDHQIDAHILLQVYDELVIEINEMEVYNLAPVIQDIMNRIADKYLDTSLGIHMSSDFKIDKNWTK